MCVAIGTSNKLRRALMLWDEEECVWKWERGQTELGEGLL